MMRDKLSLYYIIYILSLTSPLDTVRSSSVSEGFKSAADSDAIWQSFLPSDYQEIISRSDFSNGALSGSFFIDGGNKSFSLDKRSGKKRYLVGARELIIVWADDPRYWERKSHHNSRFSQVISLKYVCWLEIRGRIETRMLSQRTNYAAYLVFNFEVSHNGFDHAAIKSVIRFIDLESKSEIENRASSTIIYLKPKAREDFMNYVDQVPKSRADGWMEVEMGSFYNEQGDEGKVEARLIGFKRPHWKRGLIVEGIEFRPKCI